MIRQLLMVASVISLLGCSGGGDGYTGPRGEVTGKVTVKGQPVPAGCNVVFQTKEGPNYSAVGTVNASGEYELLYNGKKSMPAVTYTATVIPPADSSAGTMSMDQMTKNATDLTKNLKTKAKTNQPFATSYSSAMTSGLEFTVKAGPNKADFDLTP